MFVRPVKALPSRRSKSPNSAVGQSGWTQLGQQRAHLGRRAARQAAQVLKRTARLIRVPLPQARQYFGNQPSGKKRLVDGIVQVLRQALAFLQRGVRLGVFIQLRVDQCHRRLVGDGHRQVGMVRCEVIALCMCDADTANDAVLHCQRHPHPGLDVLQEGGEVLLQECAQELLQKVRCSINR